MTEETTTVKPLIVKFGEIINGKEHTGEEIVNACMTIVKTLYIDMGGAEKDVHNSIKECLTTLNELLPKEEEESKVIV